MSKEIRAPRGTKISCKSWHQEAAMRMIMNNLDPEVAEKPDELIVYGGSGKAARNWEAYHAIIETLPKLENDETLMVQSGKPVGVLKTHSYSPRVLIANKSSSLCILLVAYRSGASRASSRFILIPLSETRIRDRPPFSTSIMIRLLFASSAFSTSSLTTDAGRSTTSPAAILLERISGRILILDIIYPLKFSNK